MSTSGSTVCGQPPRIQRDLEESSRGFGFGRWMGAGREPGGCGNIGERRSQASETAFTSGEPGEGEGVPWEGNVAESW